VLRLVEGLVKHQAERRDLSEVRVDKPGFRLALRKVAAR
jgi:hypothetical protein